MNEEYLDKSNGFSKILISVLAIIFFISSCNPTKRIGGLAAKHPEEFKRVCAIVAPPETTGLKTETQKDTIRVYVKGEEVVKESGVYINLDSIYKSGIKTGKFYVKCPPSKERIDTIKYYTTVTNTITKTIIDRNKEKILESDNLILDNKNKSLKKYKWLTFIFGGLIVVAIGIGTVKKWTSIKGWFKKRQK